LAGVKQDWQFSTKGRVLLSPEVMGEKDKKRKPNSGMQGENKTGTQY